MCVLLSTPYHRRQRASRSRSPLETERAQAGFIALAAETVEREAERIIAAMLQAGYDGDWRAFQPLIDRTYGKPTEKVERKTEAVESMSLEELRVLRARLLRGHPELAKLTVVE
jgi:hypothetical protein